MKKSIEIILIFAISLSLTPLCWAPRSIHRPIDPTMPIVTTNWLGNSKKYTLKNSHYEEYPIFNISSKKYLEEQLLPSGNLSYRAEPKKTVATEKLTQLIELLLEEIKQKKRTYTHFKILSKKNFNRGKACGLLIAKFKKYPFILKLFIETPQTFINSHCKGLDNMWFFPMGGGVNRHIAGLTRVQNARNIKELIDKSSRWSKNFDIPRKWFWLPKKTPWIEIHGKNIGDEKNLLALVPGTYAVIADAIAVEKQFSFFHASDEWRALFMDLCNYLETRQDPHIDNFIIEKGSQKIVIIDTEHFATMVGFKKKAHFRNYFDWYRILAYKCINNWFFRTKQTRAYAQKEPNSLAREQLGLLR